MQNTKNVILQEPGKISIDFFRQNNLYKDIIEVGSRGLTEFTYNKIPMQIVDCAGNVRADKRIKPVFVGKYLSDFDMTQLILWLSLHQIHIQELTCLLN